MINQDDCTIEFQPDGTFKITDEKGVVYLFKDKEYAYYGAIRITALPDGIFRLLQVLPGAASLLLM